MEKSMTESNAIPPVHDQRVRQVQQTETGTLVKFLRLDPSEGFDVGKPSHFILRYDTTGTKLAWAYEDTIKIDVENVLFCNAEGDLIWAKCTDERQGLFSAWEENRRYQMLFGSRPPIKVLSAKAYIDQYNLKHDMDAQNVRVLVSKLKKLLAPDGHQPPNVHDKAIMMHEQLLQRLERLGSIERRIEAFSSHIPELSSQISRTESVMRFGAERHNSDSVKMEGQPGAEKMKVDMPSRPMANHHPSRESPTASDAKVMSLEHRLATLEDRRINKMENVLDSMQRTLERNTDRMMVLEGQLSTLIKLVGQVAIPNMSNASGGLTPGATTTPNPTWGPTPQPVNQASSTASPPCLKEESTQVLRIGNPPQAHDSISPSTKEDEKPPTRSNNGMETDEGQEAMEPLRPPSKRTRILE